MSIQEKIYTHNEFSGSLQKVCDYFKVNKSIIYMRLKNGADFNKSMNSEIQKQKIYNFQGFEGNLYEICKRFKLSHYKVCLLIRDEIITKVKDEC